MSEDVSSMVRVGVTVVLVATLVATALNLMGVSQGILGSGQSTLQSGVDQIALQEYKRYDQKRVSGTTVKSALSLYEGRDIAIVLRPTSCQKSVGGAPWAYNYGAVLIGSVADTANDTGLAYNITSALTRNAGDAFYSVNLKVTSGSIDYSSNIKGVSTTGDTEYILESAQFRGELIKDLTGTIIGIMFTQL